MIAIADLEKLVKTVKFDAAIREGVAQGGCLPARTETTWRHSIGGLGGGAAVSGLGHPAVRAPRSSVVSE